jgi:hypothetical protein
MSHFFEIRTYSNWCYIDRLDGVDLENGEKLVIQFPDGSEEEHTIKVKKFESSASDHGHTVSIPHSEAYIVLEYRGHKVEVRAAGLMARLGNSSV